MQRRSDYYTLIIFEVDFRLRKIQKTKNLENNPEFGDFIRFSNMERVKRDESSIDVGGKYVESLYQMGTYIYVHYVILYRYICMCV